MARNLMKIGKAFCRELGQTIDIQEAGISYFDQTKPRKKYSFYCSSPECAGLPKKVEILGVNYHRVPIDTEGREASKLAETDSDDDPIVAPYFRTKTGHNHTDDCQWTIDHEAEQEYIAEAESAQDRKRRRQRVAKDALIEESSFLLQENETQPVETAQPSGDDFFNDTKRRQRINQVKAKLLRPKRSPYFSALVSSYMKVLEHKLFDEPLKIIGIGETTWGKFFYPIGWYTSDNQSTHIFSGNVSITTLPYQFDWSDGDMPNAVILKFYDQVNVGETMANPSYMITRKMVSANPGAYVLMEAVQSALTDENYKKYLKLYFYGRIDAEPKKGNDSDDPVLVLNVKPLRPDTIELRRIDADR